MRLGIDFGTTRTVVAAAQRGRFPIAAFEIDGGFSEWVPGVVTERAGALRFGWDALAEPGEHVVRSLKRAITGLAPDELLDALPSRPSALDATTSFLAALREAILRSSLDVEEGEPLEVMAAVPASATSRQRFVTMEALSRAGFSVLGMIGEPSAAAIEFAHRCLGAQNKRSPKRYVVVYDLGGGTFDTSALSLEGRRFELLASEGISKLGGDDFDAAILELALDRARVDPGSLAPSDRVALLDRARSAKESMTAHSRNVLVDVASVLPELEPVVLDAASVLERCQPMVDETIALLDRLFARLPDHGIDPDNPRELGAVYVVGGAAAFVGVLRSLRARYGRKIQLAPSPHAATAIGLALAADPDSSIYVREAVTRHFGVWREGRGGRDKVFDRIFAKDAMPGSDGPLVVRRAYRPAHTVGHLRFLECSALDDSGGPAGELTPWREIFFPYHPELRDRSELERAVDHARLDHEIVETYTYAPDGAISVDIRNVSAGYGRAYELGRVG